MNPQEILRALQTGGITIEDAKKELEARIKMPEQSPILPSSRLLKNQQLSGQLSSRLRNSWSPEPHPANEDLPHEIQSIRVERTSQSSDFKETIAIVGMSGKYPEASNLNQFWHNLAHGKNSIREIPNSRWDVDQYYTTDPFQPGKIYCKWIGLLEDIEYFDPLFFMISPAEAEVMDPQHRLFMQEGYRAFEDAGYNSQSLNDKRCGVYLGIMSNEYGLLLYRSRIGETDITGNSYAIAAARISYFLNLKGPAIPIDTACSSSLVATHLACQALLNHEIEMALVGGVSLYLTPESYIGMCSAGMLSPQGQCKAFDNDANGFVPGEGVGALVLKRLKDAERDHDSIYGVIIGSGINQDGKTNGITAPSVNSQIELERGIYDKYGIDPETISYVEMHGTGTKLGDPIELEALSTVFKEKTHKNNYCAIGSVKSNIGHTSAAAGVASLQKVLLCLKHRRLAPTLNFNKPNEHFNFEESPFYVNTIVQPWEAAMPRRACVSSFGFSGTNAHIVIEEYLAKTDIVATPPLVNPNNPIIFVLSAKTEKQLHVYAKNMKSFIESIEDLNLLNLAYTLQVGREAMDYRMAFLAGSKEALLEAFDEFIRDNSSTNVFTAQVKKIKNEVSVFEADEDAQFLLQTWIQKKKLKKIAELWVKGLHIDWKKIYGEAKPRRISLPTYPFARKRYWASENQTGYSPISNSTTAFANKSSKVLEGEIQSRKMSKIVNFETTVESLVGTFMLAPVWDFISIEKGKLFPCTTDVVVIVGGDKNIIKVIQQQYPNTNVFDVQADDSVKKITQKLKVHGSSINHVFWIAPHTSLASVVDSALIDDQNQGTLYCFRMIKALLRMGYGNKELGWSVITRQTQTIHKNDSVNPGHASLHGLIGSMAKEYPGWNIRLIDLEADEYWPITDILSLPPDYQGNAWVYRGGEWYRQRLVPVHQYEMNQSLYKSGGVYVVIGGAGGIGEAWSEYMIRAYQARIVWIGRKQKNTAIQDKLKKLAGLGIAPIYISADATDLTSLQQAYDKIKKRYSRINGVIHSAIVLLDQSLSKMAEDRFKASLSAKVDVCVRIAQVFQKEQLDFVMFFSSLNSFIKAAGQSNYAAGCTFKDAFALQLSQEWSCAVKVMNWGYWGSVGIVASQEYQERMAQTGLGSIEPPEAMEALETLLAGPMDQIALMKTTKPIDLNEVDSDEFISVYPGNLRPNSLELQKHIAKHELQIQRMKSDLNLHKQEMEELLCVLLWQQLQSIGMFKKKRSAIDAMKENAGILDLYDRWLEESMKVLSRKNYLSCDGRLCSVIKTATKDEEVLWKEWDRKKNVWLENSYMKANIFLMDATLRALPEILTGKVLATDIMFPNSSMELVKGIYKDHPIADYFNEILADAVIGFLRERVQHDPFTRIRILEIGAGTGGSSATIFRKLKAYRDHIQEYCYTDISKAFLPHAEKKYGSENPYLTYKAFNVEEPIAGQNIDSGGYDLVIAANVLHATKNIRQTIRNAKAALKKNGLILLNEISSNSLFIHLTFGLLKGWWLYEDALLRIPGCPGLYPKTWQGILESEGFRSVLFPALDAHELGQQIIVAESDGVIRQKRKFIYKTVTSLGGSEKKATPIQIIEQEKIDKLSKGLEEVLADYCGIAVLNVFQSLGFLKNAGEINIRKFYDGSHLDKLVSTLLNILRKRSLIEVKGHLISLSAIGNSMETISHLQKIESRIELLIRAFPGISSYIALLKYCIEKYSAIFNKRIDSERIFRSKQVLNWIGEIFALYGKASNQFDTLFAKGISQNLLRFNNKKKLAIVDLDWIGNPIKPVVLSVLNNKAQKIAYFHVDGSNEVKKIIHEARQNKPAPWEEELLNVDVYPLRGQKEISEQISSRGKADLIILQGNLSDIHKLEKQLDFAKQVINEDGLILAGNHPLQSDISALTFGLIENRLLCQTKPSKSDEEYSWSLLFEKHGFEAETVFGEWLIMARQEFQKGRTGADDSFNDMRNRDVINFLVTLFSSILKIAQKDLDIDTNLQEYGLDSLTVSQAYISIQKEYGKIFTPNNMVDQNTIRRLADSIERHKEKLHEAVSFDDGQEPELEPDTESYNESDISYSKIQETTIVSRAKDEGTASILHNSHKTIIDNDNKGFVAQFDDKFVYSEMIETPTARQYEIVTAGEGDAIMFLTGLAFTWKIWRNQIPILRKKYRLIFPHFPGHGASVSKSGEFTFEDISDDITEILNYYQIKSCHIIGWCMGGNAAQIFTAKYPEKVKSLILVGTTPTDAGSRGVISQDFKDYSVNPLETYAIEFKNCLQHDVFQEYLSKLYLEYLYDCHCHVENVYVINYINNLFNFDSNYLLKSINIPTLVISGTWDIAFPADQVRLLHLKISGSQYIEFTQSGHLPFLTQTDLFNNKLCNYLQKCKIKMPSKK